MFAGLLTPSRALCNDFCCIIHLAVAATFRAIGRHGTVDMTIPPHGMVVIVELLQLTTGPEALSVVDWTPSVVRPSCYVRSYTSLCFPSH